MAPFVCNVKPNHHLLERRLWLLCSSLVVLLLCSAMVWFRVSTQCGLVSRAGMVGHLPGAHAPAGVPLMGALWICSRFSLQAACSPASLFDPDPEGVGKQTYDGKLRRWSVCHCLLASSSHNKQEGDEKEQQQQQLVTVGSGTGGFLPKRPNPQTCGIGTETRYAEAECSCPLSM